MVDNKIVPASTEMIKHACLNYHYAKSVPVGRKMSFAIFEKGIFKGVIIYSTGANNNIAKPFNMKQGEVVELTRVALQHHDNFVSYYLARTLNIIKEKSPRVKIIVSYADMDHQKHSGKIYQANNWIYLGISKTSDFQYLYKGKWTHQRTINSKSPAEKNRLEKTLEKRENSNKHKYIFCMNKKLRNKYLKVAKEYPK